MSEFGSGVVVCLVKFSEHIGDGTARRVGMAIRWIDAKPLEREQLLADPDPEWQFVLHLDEVASSSEEMLSDLIMVWASGASDHLIELDREVAPASLIELAELVVDLRHDAVDGRLHGEEEWLRVLTLWSAAALDLDERLDVQPDWGEW